MCTLKVLRPTTVLLPAELLTADYQKKSFEHGHLTPMQTNGQNNYLDLSEFHEIP